MRREIPLHELRRARQLSQEQLAQTLGEKQSSISKLEQRTDMYVSTLRRYLEAMGGELVIAVRFPAGALEIGQFGELAEQEGPARVFESAGKYGGGGTTKSTRVIGLKLGQTPSAVQSKASADDGAVSGSGERRLLTTRQ